MLSSVFFVMSNGRYEIHVTVKVRRELYPNQKAAELLSVCTKRKDVPGSGNREGRFWDRSMNHCMCEWKDQDIMCCRVWQNGKTDKRYLVTVFL